MTSALRTGAIAFLIGLILVPAGLAACSSSSSDSTSIAQEADSGAGAGDGGGSSQTDGNAPKDGGVDAAGDASGCEGTCPTTSLEADIGGVKRSLDRAQFGTDTGDAGSTLYTEAHAGGDPACPSESSPSTDRTLIVSGVPRGAVGRALTEADGVKAVYFDFTEEQLPTAPFTKSTAIAVTVTGEDSASPPSWVAMDVVATFAEGTVSGHLYASYCASLSE